MGKFQKQLFAALESQSWTKYMRQTLVFMWNVAIGKALIAILQQCSASIKGGLAEEWILGYTSMKFVDFSHFSYFPKMLNLKLFNNSWGNSYIPCLLLTITLCFNWGEKKIWWSIKTCQNIMSKIVGVLKNLVNSTGKHLCCSLFLLKLQA